MNNISRVHFRNANTYRLFKHSVDWMIGCSGGIYCPFGQSVAVEGERSLGWDPASGKPDIRFLNSQKPVYHMKNRCFRSKKPGF